jgi:kinesin family protein C1
LFDAKAKIEEVSRGDKAVSMTVELLEIYNEQVRDLLSPKGAGAKGAEASLKISGNKAVGSIHQPVDDEADVFRILKRAEKRRTVKATSSNETSSRSHLLFTIEYTITSKDGTSQVGKLNVCDLAGSERLAKSGAHNVGGSLLKETKAINLSLSSLSNVIEKLQAGDKNVPYRDSKLTSLLQNSLGGNSKTLCIICCNPLQAHFHETLCSLRFAAKINKVDLKSVQNFSA